MLPTRYFAFLNRTGTLVRAAVCCGVGVAFLSMASAPAFAAEMDNLKQQLRDLQNRLDQIESQQAAPPVVPKKMVRSGKSNVALTVSGQISRTSFFADDGTENGFFHTDNENSSTRWRLKGKAKIDNEWTAGTLFEQDIEDNRSTSVQIDQDVSVNGGKGFALDNRHMVIWLQSKSAGRFWIGKTNTASNNIVQIDLSGTGIVQYSGRGDLGGSFQFRAEDTKFATKLTAVKTFTDAGVAIPDVNTKGADTGANPKISTVDSQFDGMSRRNLIRYDTPKFGGFQLSASAVQGDAWDITGRYSANYKDAGLKISAGLAYWEFGERDGSGEKGFHGGIGGSISVLHSSGFNLTFAAGTLNREDKADTIDDPVTFYIKPGFQFKGSSLGKTSISVGYGRTEDLAKQNDEYENFHVAVVQNIDAAALELFAFWELNSLDRDGADFEDINIGGIGARMKF
ncbi:MAG: porin [Proteobacteria bacterium]|nr:porin [Pseudomonadota bacterium]